MFHSVIERSTNSKMRDGDMNRIQGISSQMSVRTNGGVRNKEFNSLLKIKTKLESKRSAILSTHDRNRLLNLVRNRSSFKQLTEMMDGE